jgi:hypothetical protein
VGADTFAPAVELARPWLEQRCHLLFAETRPSGNRYALFQNDRPEAMTRSYADEDNANAIRG